MKCIVCISFSTYELKITFKHAFKFRAQAVLSFEMLLIYIIHSFRAGKYEAFKFRL